MPFGWLEETCCGEGWGAMCEYECDCCGVGGMATAREAARGQRCRWARQARWVNAGTSDVMRRRWCCTVVGTWE